MSQIENRSTETGSRKGSLLIYDSEESGTRKDSIKTFIDLHVLAPGRVAWNDWRTRVGILLVLFFIGLGTVGVALVPDPVINQAPTYTKPFVNWEVPFGTDKTGTSIWRQLVHATPAMLKMAFAGAVAASSAAVAIGMTAGYKSGRIDDILMGLTDIMLTIPGLPLIILLAAIYQPEDPFVIGLILAIDNWPGLARTVRSQVLTIRNESYVEASHAMGLSTVSIIRQNILPQLMPYILINSAGAGRRVIFESVSLYFLGILSYSEQNWGVMMNAAYTRGAALTNLGRAGYWLFIPMIALVLLSFGLILLSQGLDRVFNPRLRARHSSVNEGDSDEM